MWVVYAKVLLIKKYLFKKESKKSFTFLIYIKGASQMTLFLFLSTRESPYRSTSFLTLSHKNSKLSETDFTLFISSIRCLEKW